VRRSSLATLSPISFWLRVRLRLVLARLDSEARALVQLRLIPNAGVRCLELGQGAAQGPGSLRSGYCYCAGRAVLPESG
jgi:hypothetical protein